MVRPPLTTIDLRPSRISPRPLGGWDGAGTQVDRRKSGFMRPSGLNYGTGQVGVLGANATGLGDHLVADPDG